ncbi:MAG: RHS repeat-associated core domain-containing protein [Polyangiaceae bacterium]
MGGVSKKTKYDPQRTAPVTTLYTWDGEVLAAEIDTEQGPRSFVHAPGTFEPMLQQQNGEVFLCVNDHLGMPKDLVAGDGAVAWSATHSAYGRVVATYADETSRSRYGTAINSPFRLLGQVADDDAELCFTRYRCFDPEIGSWISSDPLEVAGGLNLYGFDRAPTDVVDPLGLAGNKHGRELKAGETINRGMVKKNGVFVSSPQQGAPNATQKGVRTDASSASPDVHVASPSAMVGPGHTGGAGLSGSVTPVQPNRPGMVNATVDAGSLPKGLKAVNDHGDHVSIVPAHDMTAGEYQDLLNQVPWS